MSPTNFGGGTIVQYNKFLIACCEHNEESFLPCFTDDGESPQTRLAIDKLKRPLDLVAFCDSLISAVLNTSSCHHVR
jgi:hypothetical protein